MASAPAGSGWTTGRIIALAAGSVLLLISLALIAGGGILAWADTEQLHSGYLASSASTYSTSGYALASDRIGLHGTCGCLRLLVDRVRVRVRIWASDPSRPLFAGVAATGDVQRYLAGVGYTGVGVGGGHDVTDHPGTGIPAAPASALPWATKVQGKGSLTLTWDPWDGDYVVVVMMNQDASPGVTVRADAGVSAPALAWLAGELLADGVLLGLAAGALIIVPVRLVGSPMAGSRAGTGPTTATPPGLSAATTAVASSAASSGPGRRGQRHRSSKRNPSTERETARRSALPGSARGRTSRPERRTLGRGLGPRSPAGADRRS
jgi:hypothetical protein